MGVGPFTERWRRAQSARPSAAAAGRLWRGLARAGAAAGRGRGAGRRASAWCARAGTAGPSSWPRRPRWSSRRSVLRPSLTQPNIADPERFRVGLPQRARARRECSTARPSPWSCPIPWPASPSSRRAELGAGRPSELDELVRFRLRKSLPFDVREARVAARPLLARRRTPDRRGRARQRARRLRGRVPLAGGSSPGLVELSGLALCRSAFGAGRAG